MRNFEFHRPGSVGEAVALLRARPGAKALAGGQSFLPVMKLDLAEPSDLVSLAAIGGLREIRAEAGLLVIGALVTHDEVSTSPVVRRTIPGLALLAGGIGDAQVRNRGTLGGSLAHGDPAADYPAAVVGLGATIVTDRREIAAADFFTGLFATALGSDEVITEVRFPVPECCAYAKFPHRASKYAVVGVLVAKLAAGSAAAAGAGAVRVAVTGAGPKVFRVPKLEQALAAHFAPEAVESLGEGVVAAADLRTDGEASAEYRAHLVAVMARRAVQRAAGS